MLASAVYLGLIDAAMEAAHHAGVERPLERLWTHREFHQVFHAFGVLLVASAGYDRVFRSTTWKQSGKTCVFYNASLPLCDQLSEIYHCLFEVIATNTYPDDCASDPYWCASAANCAMMHMLPMIETLARDTESAASRLAA